MAWRNLQCWLFFQIALADWHEPLYRSLEHLAAEFFDIERGIWRDSVRWKYLHLQLSFRSIEYGALRKIFGGHEHISQRGDRLALIPTGQIRRHQPAAHGTHHQATA